LFSAWKIAGKPMFLVFFTENKGINPIEIGKNTVFPPVFPHDDSKCEILQALHKFKKRPNTTDKRPSKRRMQKLLSSGLTHDESLL
jgi:hypothetical protein